MKQISTALVKFHIQLKPVAKDSENPFFKSDYLSLSGILDAVRPILSSVGLAILQPMRVDGDKTILITQIIHESGEMIQSEMILPGHQDPQKYGSLITYYKRYQLQALLGISTREEDDDCNMVARSGEENKPKSNWNQQSGDYASPAQINLMNKLGIKFQEGISKKAAGDLIAEFNNKQGRK